MVAHFHRNILASVCSTPARLPRAGVFTHPRLGQLLVKLALLFALSAAQLACTRIDYRSPDGAVVTVERWGYDTKIGKLSAGRDPRTGAVHVLIENWDSQAKAMDAVIAALEVAKVAGGAP